MAFLDGPAFFRNTVLPTFGGTGAVKRVPFTFTSTARLLRSGKLKAVGNKYAQLVADEERKSQLGAIELETRGVSAASQLGLSGVVSQFQNVAQLSVGLNMPVIQMAVNPQTIKWTQNKRVSRRDTMEGSVFFHFTNARDQNNDILTLSFTGKTGNINTQANLADVYNTGANLKLRIWHELYNLSREPLLLNKQNTGLDVPLGLKNEFFITYRTQLMPVQITLIGFFSKVLEFTELAADPHNRDYGFDFTVTNTSPSLDDLAGLMNSGLSTAGSLQNLGSSITSLSRTED